MSARHNPHLPDTRPFFSRWHSFWRNRYPKKRPPMPAIKRLQSLFCLNPRCGEPLTSFTNAGLPLKKFDAPCGLFFCTSCRFIVWHLGWWLLLFAGLTLVTFVRRGCAI